MECRVIHGLYAGRTGKIVRAAYPKDYVVLFENGTQTSFYESELEIERIQATPESVT